MNIIYEVDRQNLRFIGLNPNTKYQLNDLNFYIPKEYKNAIPFLLIKDSKEKQDIIKLAAVGADNNYNIFSVALANSILVMAGPSVISLLLITDDTFTFSNSQFLLLDFEKYNIAHQISLIEDLSKNLITTYKKIEQLTNINIDIYENIEEVMNK